jgi:hypothetical protein
MPQPTIELVRNLITQFNLFHKLCVNFALSGPDLKFAVSLSYTRNRFNVRKGNDLLLQFALEGETSEIEIIDIFYQDKHEVDLVKEHFVPLVTGSLVTGANVIPHTSEMNRYLAVAESIAGCTYLCAAGDDYRPGYFSEITVDNEGVTLRQINHMNAKSLDHRNDYSLRDLEFFIPFNEVTDQSRLKFGEETIGKMRVSFSDRSSDNNRKCGDRVEEKIAEERLQFGR